MSEEFLQTENTEAKAEERDLLDGGFAVVDREKIIEEETRTITPWPVHFINLFIAPRKMMEENFHQDPPKGMSIGIVGSILFGVIATILTFANSAQKEQVLNTLRMAGTAEEMISQQYAMAQVTGVIGVVAGVFLSALFIAVPIQIAKAIAKDKGKFGLLYTIALFAQTVSYAIMVIDRLIGLLIPTTNIVLGLPILFSPDLASTNPTLNAVASVFTLPSLASMAILVIGYSVITRASMKKSITIIAIVEVFFVLVAIGATSIGMMMTQGMTGGM